MCTLPSKESEVAYGVVNIICFVGENPKLFRNNGAHIIARAFRATEQSSIQPMFPHYCLAVIFGDPSLTQCFNRQVEMDTVRQALLGFGRQSIDVPTVLGALFGNDVPQSLTGKNGEELRREIGRVLRERGVDWEDGWLEGVV